MKTRFLNISLAVLLIFAFCSCTSKHGIFTYYAHVEGLENYHTASGSFETDLFLFPYENYVEVFSYIDSGYMCEIDDDLLNDSLEKSFAWFRYTEEIYEAAFSDIFEKVSFQDKQFNIGKNTFFLRDMTSYYAAPAPTFPEWFWMVFFNEDEKIVGFLGYYAPLEKQTYPADGNFEDFIRNEFDCFDWETLK